jgi:hypothetical protein
MSNITRIRIDEGLSWEEFLKQCGKGKRIADSASKGDSDGDKKATKKQARKRKR